MLSIPGIPSGLPIEKNPTFSALTTRQYLHKIQILHARIPSDKLGFLEKGRVMKNT